MAEERTFTLTRMIYTLSGAALVCEIFQLGTWLAYAKLLHPGHWLFSTELFLHAPNLIFVLAMLAIALFYRPFSRLVRWRPEAPTNERPVVGVLKSIGLGLAGGVVGFVLTIPTLWIGGRQMESIVTLIADAMSPLGVLELVLLILALAISSEIVWRGIVLKTLANHATLPSAILASCVAFGFVFPALLWPAAIVLSVTASLLFYYTRNLLAPIIANALLLFGANAFVLYRALTKS